MKQTLFLAAALSVSLASCDRSAKTEAPAPSPTPALAEVEQAAPLTEVPRSLRGLWAAQDRSFNTTCAGGESVSYVEIAANELSGYEWRCRIDGLQRLAGGLEIRASCEEHGGDEPYRRTLRIDAASKSLTFVGESEQGVLKQCASGADSASIPSSDQASTRSPGLILGPPPNLDRQSGTASAAIAAFRRRVSSPLVMTDGRPVNWDALLEREVELRALFYYAKGREPDLITVDDEINLLEVETSLLSQLCGNYSQAVEIFKYENVSEADCVGVE